MNVLLTGASGFLGRRVCAALHADSRITTVLAVVRDSDAPINCVPVRADLSQPDWTQALPRTAVDIVLHLAQSRRFRDPAGAADVHAVNVIATAGLARWAADRGVRRFLFTSTGNVYGSSSSIRQESDPSAPSGTYAESKRGAEQVLEPFDAQMDVGILRLFGIYGPAQPSGLVPEIIRRFDAEEPITLAGGIGVRYNPLHVDDCVRAVVELATAEGWNGHEIVNVGGVQTVTIADLVAILEQVSGRNARLVTTGDAPQEFVGSVEKLQRLTGFRPSTPISEGIAQTYAARSRQGFGRR